MRIQNAVDDQVILLVRRAEEIAGIVDRQVDARVVIGTLGMIFPAEEGDGGIDLDGVDMGGAHPQRGRHVIAAAGADDGHALRRLLEIVRKFVIGADEAIGVGFLTAPVVGEIVDLLVVAAARQDLHQSVGLGGSLQQLVRRIDPLRLGLHRPGQDGQQHAKARDPDREEVVARQHEQQQDAARHREPDHRRQPVQAHHEQGDHARECCRRG